MIDIKPPSFVRQVSLDLKRFVIFLRFASLTEEKVVSHSAKEIMDITGLKHKTIWSIIYRWRRDGHEVRNSQIKRG